MWKRWNRSCNISTHHQQISQHDRCRARQRCVCKTWRTCGSAIAIVSDGAVSVGFSMAIHWQKRCRAGQLNDRKLFREQTEITNRLSPIKFSVSISINFWTFADCTIQHYSLTVLYLFRFNFSMNMQRHCSVQKRAFRTDMASVTACVFSITRWSFDSIWNWKGQLWICLSHTSVARCSKVVCGEIISMSFSWLP